jgi:hypothetical protein
MKKFTFYYDNSKNKQQLVVTGKMDTACLEGDTEHKKCLPLKIAGELGWDIILPDTYKISWNGGNSPKDIEITTSQKTDFISSSLGYGIITFKIPYLFELEKDTFIWIKGPSNNPVSLDLYALEGVVEADWFPSHITMNYKVVSKNKEIILEKGKPYCRLIPYPKNYIEEFIPQYEEMEKNENFSKKYMNYNYVNRFLPFSKSYLTSYIKGMLGKEKVVNVPKIRLSLPKETFKEISKCPLHKLL